MNSSNKHSTKAKTFEIDARLRIPNKCKLQNLNMWIFMNIIS